MIFILVYADDTARSLFLIVAAPIQATLSPLCSVRFLWLGGDTKQQMADCFRRRWY